MRHHLQDGERLLHAEGEGPGALPQTGKRPEEEEEEMMGGARRSC